MIKKYHKAKDVEEDEDLDTMAEDDEDADEDENDACAVCYGLEGEEDNQLVFCDCCDAAYHQECHRPRITDVSAFQKKNIYKRPLTTGIWSVEGPLRFASFVPSSSLALYICILFLLPAGSD